ncbi:hypothetical protein M758_9G051400 [Ceratodon purpureus]|nr:hypothetical protein M758_9G051400 [Ceratodon purpureus]
MVGTDTPTQKLPKLRQKTYTNHPSTLATVNQSTEGLHFPDANQLRAHATHHTTRIIHSCRWIMPMVLPQLQVGDERDQTPRSLLTLNGSQSNSSCEDYQGEFLAWRWCSGADVELLPSTLARLFRHEIHES